MRLTLLAALMTIPTAAYSQSADWADELLTATEIGQIIGGAETCGYQLDEAKVTAIMETKVAEMETTSRMNLSNARSAQSYQLGQMSPIERKSECALHAKLAEKYGLTP